MSDFQQYVVNKTPAQAAPAAVPTDVPMYTFRRLRDSSEFGVAIQTEVPAGTYMEGVPVTRKDGKNVPINIKVFYCGNGYSLAAVVGEDGMTSFERSRAETGRGQVAPTTDAQDDRGSNSGPF